MEINGKNSLAGLHSSIQRLDQGQKQTSRAKQSVEENPATDSDRIELSVRSRDIEHLDALIRSTPDVRMDKVEQVRSAIENGTYSVKAEKIADKIITGNIIDEVF
jgi:negative regulator of flagellin synthesis FlgM